MERKPISSMLRKKVYKIPISSMLWKKVYKIAD